MLISRNPGMRSALHPNQAQKPKPLRCRDGKRQHQQFRHASRASSAKSFSICSDFPRNGNRGTCRTRTGKRARRKGYFLRQTFFFSFRADSTRGLEHRMRTARERKRRAICKSDEGNVGRMASVFRSCWPGICRRRIQDSASESAVAVAGSNRRNVSSCCGRVRHF